MCSTLYTTYWPLVHLPTTRCGSVASHPDFLLLFCQCFSNSSVYTTHLGMQILNSWGLDSLGFHISKQLRGEAEALVPGPQFE